MDLQEERIATARALLPNSVTLKSGSATRIDFSDQTFDLLFQSTVFSSIFDNAVRQQIANEMLRVLKPDGCIVWYDFHVNNPLNPDVRGVKKGEVKRLFPIVNLIFTGSRSCPLRRGYSAAFPHAVPDALRSQGVHHTLPGNHYQGFSQPYGGSLFKVLKSEGKGIQQDDFYRDQIEGRIHH